MQYSLTLVTPPAEEPISLAEAKAHLRVTFSDDDSLITRAITAARQTFEEATYRQLVTATWDLKLDRFPRQRAPILVPRAPLASVTSIKYTDTAGAEQTINAANYRVSAGRQPGQIARAFAYAWPTPLNEPDVVAIRFVAGYGGAADVPAAIKEALLLLVGQYYEFREELISGTIIAQLPTGAERIMRQYDLGDELMIYGAGHDGD